MSLIFPNLKNHLLGTQAKSQMEQVYMYGSAANRRELAINMGKTGLCIEMEGFKEKGKKGLRKILKRFVQNPGADIKKEGHFVC